MDSMSTSCLYAFNCFFTFHRQAPCPSFATQTSGALSIHFMSSSFVSRFLSFQSSSSPLTRRSSPRSLSMKQFLFYPHHRTLTPSFPSSHPAFFKTNCILNNNSQDNSSSTSTGLHASKSSSYSLPSKLPRLIVFDLDGTLWYPEMYQLWGGGSPFKFDKRSGNVIDSSGNVVRLLGNSRDLLYQLATDPMWTDQGTKIAISSRTDEPNWAQECMRKILLFPEQAQTAVSNNTDVSRLKNTLVMKEVFHYEQITKSSKVEHFRALKAQSSIEFDQMIFFDNERWNIDEVGQLGVHCAYVPRGMTTDSWFNALQSFASKSK